MAVERSGDPPKVETILVVDDEEWMRDACGVILGKEGFRVAVAPDAKTGLEQFATRRPDLVLVDVRMPGSSGLEFLRSARALDPELVAVVITGYATIEVAVDAMKAGAHDFLAKPFEPRELRAVVRRGLEQRRLQNATAALEHGPPGTHGLHVAVLAHQIKSPIASLRQCLDVVLRGYVGGLPEKALGMVEVAARRADQAIALLDDWLALMRLEEGEYLNRTETVDLREVLADVVAGCAEAPEAAGKQIVPPGDGEDAAVRGDRGALRELFRNLVTNAVRYTPVGGRIELGLELRGDDVVVSVHDNGPGVPEEERRRIFEPFYRGKAQRGIPGDGLGLPIALRIARSHGGDLELDGGPGTGTTFRVTLPLAGDTSSAGESAAAGAG
ncbi:MAG: HAMP domain-containing histidine kinase [Deltaproteobacteria bacterium]|nr:HAMP domain-containing histidine kinase [Deltaproteobacteria bacterium]